MCLKPAAQVTLATRCPHPRCCAQPLTDKGLGSERGGSGLGHTADSGGAGTSLCPLRLHAGPQPGLGEEPSSVRPHQGHRHGQGHGSVAPMKPQVHLLALTPAQTSECPLSSDGVRQPGRGGETREQASYYRRGPGHLATCTADQVAQQEDPRAAVHPSQAWPSNQTEGQVWGLHLPEHLVDNSVCLPSSQLGGPWGAGAPRLQVQAVSRPSEETGAGLGLSSLRPQFRAWGGIGGCPWPVPLLPAPAGGASGPAPAPGCSPQDSLLMASAAPACRILCPEESWALEVRLECAQPPFDGPGPSLSQAPSLCPNLHRQTQNRPPLPPCGRPLLLVAPGLGQAQASPSRVAP